MIRRFLLLLAFLAAPAFAQLPPPRTNAIQPELVAETRAVPGQPVDLAIVMHTRKGWHGYWQNPGDAGLPMRADWTLPAGASVGPLRYPVPTRLIIAGLMNYVYERDHAILVRLNVPAGATGPISVRAKLNWLACTDEVCVPERGEVALDVPMTRRGDRRHPLRRMAPRLAATARHSGALRRSRRPYRGRCAAARQRRGRRTLSLPRRRRGGRLCRAANLPPRRRHTRRQPQGQRQAADRLRRRAFLRRSEEASPFPPPPARCRQAGAPSAILAYPRASSLSSAPCSAGCCSTSCPASSRSSP